MNSVVIFIILSSSLLAVIGEQCRYVTVPVCDGDGASSQRNNVTSKGEKGDKGFSGKIGPKGIKGDGGAEGDKGQKGAKGATAQVEELQEHLSQRMDAMQASLDQLLLPPNCASSSIVGYQLLRSGENVYCDGGWMVFQRRFDGSVDFQRSWNEYKNGFGNFSTEFWLGLDKLHEATNRRGCRLRVDLWDFNDDHAYAEYSDFFIEDEEDLYRLHVGGYKGTAGDSLNYHNEYPFTTPDRDNDEHSSRNCATNANALDGGWWFRTCFNSKLNAEWGRSTGSNRNILWRHWKGYTVAIKVSVMKLRCD